MNREIKFRDYNPETGSLRYFDMDSYDKYEHDSYGNIMQFTGHKDENGMEIYEGDIVIYGDYKAKTEVRWNNEFTGFFPFLSINCLPIEVIGNIHQNKNLLNDR